MADNSNTTVIDPYFVNVNIWTKYGVSIFFSLAVLIGIPGNTMIILVHTKTRDKIVTDWMIFFIALCDLLSLFVVPLYMALFNGLWALYYFPNFLCKILYFCLNAATLSAYHFCACTALERFYKVVLSKDLFSIKVAKLICIPIFIVSSGFATITVFAVNNNANGHCVFDMKMRHMSEIGYVFRFFISIVASVCILVSYLSIGVFILRNMKDILKSDLNSSFAKSYKNTVQTTKMLAIVTIVFLLSANVPVVATSIHASNMSSKEPFMTISVVLATTFVVNNFLNPIIYFAMCSAFRQRSLAILRSCFWNRNIAPGRDTSSNSVKCGSEGNRSTVEISL